MNFKKDILFLKIKKNISKEKKLSWDPKLSDLRMGENKSIISWLVIDKNSKFWFKSKFSSPFMNICETDFKCIEILSTSLSGKIDIKKNMTSVK